MTGLFCFIGDNGGDVILTGAEGAKAGAVGSNGFFHRAIGEGVGLVQGLAILMGVVDLAEGSPEDVAVDGFDRRLLLLNGYGVKS